MAPDSTPRPPHPPRQLNGWKEISAYFGRSTRTVQRWERDFRLPIRRFGLGRSEVVHAYVDDLERWKATAEAEAARASSLNGVEHPEGTATGTVPCAQAEDDIAVPTWRWRTLRLKILLAAIVLAGLTTVSLWPPGATNRSSSAGEPAVWDAVADTLTVKNAAGRVLWTHQFPFRPVMISHPGQESVHIEDLDGDGRKEVLVSTDTPGDKENFRFYAFAHDGALRWTYAHRAAQTFGDDRYEPPFLANKIVLTSRPGGGKNLWLISVHSPWFPSVVSKVEADGQASSEYWSNGFITALWEGEVAGARVVLVGARNNESEGASVALLDAASPSGSAPASDPRYVCRTCPPGSPKYFIQIPKPARLRALHGTSAVSPFQVEANSRIIVRVDHGFDVVGFQGDVIYTLDHQLRPVSVGLSDRYEWSTDVLARKKAIPPPPATSALEEVRRIRWWDGTRFVDLVAPVAAGAATAARSRNGM